MRAGGRSKRPVRSSPKRPSWSSPTPATPLRLVDAGVDSLRSIRGQQTYLAVPPFAAPRVVVGGDGYVLPEYDGTRCAAPPTISTARRLRPTSGSHALNIARVEHMLPGSTARVASRGHEGGVGIRCVATDRMPMVGAMVDVATARTGAAALSGAHFADLPRLPGLYGAFAFASRGLSWTLLAAELLASQMHGEPLPLERALVDAVDPGRFILHRLRRGKL